MAEHIRLPRVGTAELGTVTQWYRRSGEWVNQGDAIVAVDFDKVIVDIEAPKSGYLSVAIAEGATVSAGGNLGWILVHGEPAPPEAYPSEFETSVSGQEDHRAMARKAFLDSLFGLRGRVAVVTGAAEGLGRTIAIGLAQAGADLVAVDINDAGLRETTDQISGLGVRALAVHCDIGLPAEVDHLFEVVDAEFKRIDVLVNDAAINQFSEMPEHYPLEGWERTLRINLTGAFLCSREAGRRMIASGKGGSIINISSINGSTAAGRGSLAFGVSKAGLNQLTRDLAIEWAPHRIRVNAIQPCQFLSRGWSEVTADPNQRELVHTVLRGIPLGRMGELDEIVGPVLFLASDAASMVTGVMLPVDGGNLAMNAGAGGRLPTRNGV
jgi:NAD(P)-dependent dehydrogenase (short-subunit alcohol dehydrogenase family)